MKTILSLKNASYRIPFGPLIFENLNLEIYEGQFLGVLGHNGACKTTLIDIIMVFRGVTGGTISIFDEDPHLFNSGMYKNKISFLSQDVGLKGDISIADFLQFHSGFFPNYSKQDESNLLSKFKMSPEQTIGSLSTGQQKKIQIVAGLAANTQLIIVDEITAVLDPETRFLFFSTLKETVKTKNTSIILATNIAEDLISIANRVLFLTQGGAKEYDPCKILELFNVGKSA